MDAQEAGNWASVAVALATGWLAYITAKVAKSSKDALSLQTQPYLAFQGISVEVGSMPDLSGKLPLDAVRLGWTLRNAGKVPIDYEVLDAEIEVDGNRFPPIGKDENKKGRIYPENVETYFYPGGRLSAPLRAGSQAKMALSMRFNAPRADPHRLNLGINVHFSHVGKDVVWTWTHATEPKYSEPSTTQPSILARLTTFLRAQRR